MEALLGAQLVNKTGGSKATADALSGVEVVGLYFSAHWCGPCRGFTPELGKFYETLRKSRGASSFEIVFVSSDKDEEEFTKYHGEQADWLALPFASRDLKAALSKKYKVQGIPSLVLIDGKTGALITTDGRSGVGMGPANFPYRREPFADLCETVECNGSDINEKAAILMLGDKMEGAAQATAIDSLKQVARENKDEKLLFFFASKGDGPVGQVRAICDALDVGVNLVKLDIPDGNSYYVSSQPLPEISKENINEFIRNPGNRKQFLEQ